MPEQNLAATDRDQVAVVQVEIGFEQCLVDLKALTDQGSKHQWYDLWTVGRSIPKAWQ